MADRQLYAAFVDTGERAVITLYKRNAPVTCDTLWQALATPVRMTAIHAMFAGPEIMMGLPESAQDVRPQGHSTREPDLLPGGGRVPVVLPGKETS